MHVGFVAAQNRELPPLQVLLYLHPVGAQVGYDLPGRVVVDDVENLFMALQPLAHERRQHGAVLPLGRIQAAEVVPGLEPPQPLFQFPGLIVCGHVGLPGD
ncbi:MAG: hypothetical protein H6R38_292 [Deltaproteobacteria bacterium]|jgi:hypothetical protein|nr:hypothetical protein [Deltaproteobacteria bacterium]